MTDYRKLIAQLRAIGLDTTDIAAACDRHRTWVTRYEYGATRKIDVSVARALDDLAKFYGITACAETHAEDSVML